MCIAVHVKSGILYADDHLKCPLITDGPSYVFGTSVGTELNFKLHFMHE